MNEIIQHEAFCVWLLSRSIFQDSSMLFHVSVLHLFLLPNNIPLYGHATVYLLKRWRTRRIKRRNLGSHSLFVPSQDQIPSLMTQSMERNRMEHSSISKPPSFWTIVIASYPRVTLPKILVSISAIHCRCAKMTSSFSGLLGVHVHAHTHTHTHTYPFSSELGKISVDTISVIRIFAFKGINLAQGSALGISLVLLFFPILSSCHLKWKNSMTTCGCQLLSWPPLIPASWGSCPCVISFLRGTEACEWAWKQIPFPQPCPNQDFEWDHNPSQQLDCNLMRYAGPKTPTWAVPNFVTHRSCKIIIVCCLKLLSLGNSLAVQWLGLSAFTAGARVQSLVRELRSHQPHGEAKKRKKTTKFGDDYLHNNRLIAM